LSHSRISLLTELLKTFTEKELVAFIKFVESEYFNKDKKLVILLKKLRRYALNAEKFTSQIQLKVYEDTYCELPLKQTELTKKQYVFLNNKQHKLLRLAEKFLMIENLETNEISKMDLLYYLLIDRKQINLYSRNLKSLTNKLNNESIHGIGYYTSQYKVQEITLSYLIKNGQITATDNYNELQYYLNINYILEKLKYHLAQLTLTKAYKNKHYEYSSLTEISGLLKKPVYAENPLIQIYLGNISLVEKQSDEPFNKLFETLTHNQKILPAEFLLVFYSNLTNFCSAQIRKGNASYYKKLFDIYKIMHQYHLLIFDDFISSNLVKNIITVSCALKEFEWANNFLLHYKKVIPKKISDSIYFYNKGVIDFNKNNFDAAQDWFLQVDKISDTYEMGLRVFMLQCIFEIEQDYNEATKQSFESAKQFFKRNTKLAAINKKSYLNFISSLISLYKFKHKASKLELPKIMHQINSMAVVHKKKWLMDKIAELG